MSEYCKNCKELQREIEKAKEENTRLFSAGIELNESREFFREKFWDADKSRDSWREQAEHYKQALDEIEKIAKQTRDEYMKEKSDKKDYYNAMIYGLGGLTQIRDIISEAKGANVENT